MSELNFNGMVAPFLNGIEVPQWKREARECVFQRYNLEEGYL
jgi:hypothetical protein